MAKYEQYAEYKDSGIEWLGDIPKDWQIKRLKYLCKINTGTKDTVNAIEDGIYPFFVRSQTVERINSYGADCEAVLTAGDGVGVGKVYHYINGKFDYHQRVYMLSEFNQITGRFLYYYLSSNFYKVALQGNAKSTVDSLRLPQFLNFEFSLPSLEEQPLIVSYLDHETAQIDTLINKQQTLIQLLKEKRQAVISHAVTKGLNPDTPMKDSGVEWLGEVPEHWEVSKLKYLISEPLQYGANEAAEDIDPTQPRFVRITDVLPNGDLKDDTFRSLPKDIAEPYMLKDGDVLLARSGGTVGKSFIYRDSWGKCCFAGYLIKAKIDKNITPAEWFYLNTLTDFYWKWIESIQIQATIQNVSADKYNSFVIAVPPLEESYTIISYIKSNLEVFDTLVMKAEQTIQLMQERRTALISAAVTGKIDVRGWRASE